MFNNKHTNKRLQKDFNDYGYNDFCFDIYLICTKDALLQEEKRIQIEIGINNLYNLKISGYYMDEELRKQYANTDKSSHKTKEFREKKRVNLNLIILLNMTLMVTLLLFGIVLMKL